MIINNITKMKKIILTMAAAMTALAGLAAPKGNFNLKVDLKNFGDTMIVVIPGASRNDSKKETVVAKNGTFEVELTIDKPTTLQLVTPATMRQEETKYTTVVAVPGEKCELKGDLNDRYDIGGSKFYQEYHEADIVLEKAKQPLVDLQKALMARMKAGESQETIMKEYQEKAPALQKAYSDAVMGFVKSHPDSEASAAIIPNLDEVKLMEQAVALLSPAVKNGRMKAFYNEPIEEIKNQEAREAENAKKQAPGVVAPDFTLKDINGKDLALSSFRGKYVLLDFWGSWCGWCIKGMPKMKEYYEKYAGKFEILGVDCNDTDAKWKAAVQKNQLPWLHVYNPRDSKVLADYGVTGFPTKVLVGPDGKIVKTVVGEDPAFYTFLDETFGK